MQINVAFINYFINVTDKININDKQAHYRNKYAYISGLQPDNCSQSVNLLLSKVTFCWLFVTKFCVGFTVGGLLSQRHLLVLICWFCEFGTTIPPICSSIQRTGYEYNGTNRYERVTNDSYLWTADDVCCTVWCRKVGYCCSQTKQLLQISHFNADCNSKNYVRAQYLQGWMQDFGLEGALAEFWGTEVPQRRSGAEPQWGLGEKPPEARRMLRHEADKNHVMERKNKSIHCMTISSSIISSTHHFLFPAIFVVKYKTPTTSGCGATSAVQSEVFWHAGHRIRWRNNIGLNNIGLMKRVSWKEHYRNVRKLVI